MTRPLCTTHARTMPIKGGILYTVLILLAGLSRPSLAEVELGLGPLWRGLIAGDIQGKSGVELLKSIEEYCRKAFMSDEAFADGTCGMACSVWQSHASAVHTALCWDARPVWSCHASAHPSSHCSHPLLFLAATAREVLGDDDIHRAIVRDAVLYQVRPSAYSCLAATFATSCSRAVPQSCSLALAWCSAQPCAPVIPGWRATASLQVGIPCARHHAPIAQVWAGIEDFTEAYYKVLHVVSVYQRMRGQLVRKALQVGHTFLLGCRGIAAIALKKAPYVVGKKLVSTSRA